MCFLEASDPSNIQVRVYLLTWMWNVASMQKMQLCA